MDADDNGPADPIELTFWEFHHENPKVYEALRRIALHLLERGHDHYGIKALCEIVRYEHAIETNDPTFRINNNYTALYARLLMRTEPRLAEFFEIRERVSRRRLEVA